MWAHISVTVKGNIASISEARQIKQGPQCFPQQTPITAPILLQYHTGKHNAGLSEWKQAVVSGRS